MTTSRPSMTQRDNIKKHLKDGYSLTALEALSLFGAYRLAAHIHILIKREGMSIVKTMNTDVTGRTYARYKLAPVVAGSYAHLMGDDFPRPIVHQKELTCHAH